MILAPGKFDIRVIGLGGDRLARGFPLKSTPEFLIISHVNLMQEGGLVTMMDHH